MWPKITAIKQIEGPAVTRIPRKVCPSPYWYTSTTRKPSYYTTTGLLMSHYKWCEVHFSSVLPDIWISNLTLPTFHPCPSTASTTRINRCMPGYNLGTTAEQMLERSWRGLLCTHHLILMSVNIQLKRNTQHNFLKVNCTFLVQWASQSHIPCSLSKPFSSPTDIQEPLPIWANNPEKWLTMV